MSFVVNPLTKDKIHSEFLIDRGAFKMVNQYWFTVSANAHCGTLLAISIPAMCLVKPRL